MTRLRFFLLLIVALVVSVVCVADPSPSPLPDPASTQTTLQTLWAWMMAHQIVLGMVLASVLDFLFALNPSWASNGILHFIYLWARKKAGLPDPVTP